MKLRIKAYSNRYYEWVAYTELFDKAESESIRPLSYCNKLEIHHKQCEKLLICLHPEYYWTKYEPSGRHNNMVAATRLEF